MFNIRKDLQPGDKIRRIKASGHLTEGEVYTFEKYGGTGLLNVKGYTPSFASEYFEFVSRPKYVKTSTFEHSKVGDEVYSLLYGEGNIYNIFEGSNDSYPFDATFKDSEGSTRNISFNKDGFCASGLHTQRTIFLAKPEFAAPQKEYEIENNLFRAEFIVAMKQVAKEYIDGTHDWSSENCALCVTMRKVLNVTDTTSVNCKKVCPWVIITGNTCSPNVTGLERAKELLEWIKIYEEKLAEESK